jgi:hypothetical protein
MHPVVESEREKQQKIRQEAYEKGLVSRHSADFLRPFKPLPRFFSAEQSARYKECRTPPSVNMTDEEKRLHGLIPYE